MQKIKFLGLVGLLLFGWGIAEAATSSAVAMASMPRDAKYRQVYSSNTADFHHIVNSIKNKTLPYRISRRRKAKGSSTFATVPKDFGAWDKAFMSNFFDKTGVSVIDSSPLSDAAVYFWIDRKGILGGPAKGIAFITSTTNSWCDGHVGNSTEGSKQGTRCARIEGDWYIIYRNN